MASPGYRLPQPDQVRGMISEVKSLINARLKDILRDEHLPVSGVKSELQIRIIAHIEKLSNAGDTVGLNRVRDLITGNPRYNSNYSPYPTYTPPASASPQYSSPIPNQAQLYGNNSMMSNSLYPPTKRLTFKPSPFYRVRKNLSAVTECKIREHTRDTVRVVVCLTQEDADQLQRDSNIRVMIFCAVDSSFTSLQHSEIAFPHQVELKCNSDEVKANLRGLKNKPGSTRPADITHLIRKKANYPNNIEMIYALTQKEKPGSQKFFVVVNLVQKFPIEELVSDLKRKRPLTKERILSEMTNKAKDSDIETTSTVMSLKCPLSAMRIAVPCRSLSCAHNSCFDAASYLQLQEQAPTWTCPICNKAAGFEDLTVDMYVDDILKRTSTDTEQVTIEPDGRWYKQGSGEGMAQNNNPTPEDDEDEGFIEIHDDRILGLRQQNRYPSAVRTPPISSREDSIASSVPRSNKRPASEVIDLTLTDDDDDGAPPAKVKRPSMSGSGSGSFRSRPPDSTFSFEFTRPGPPNFSLSPFNTNL